MPQITVKYWRDIPSMVSIGRGRSAARAQLPERFEQAIDRCAMKVGAKDDDAYLAEWRNAPLEVVQEDGETPQDVADRTVAELDRKYDQEMLRALIDRDGWEEARAKG